MLLRKIAVGLLMAAALLAQGERGTFNGTVLDGSGAAVAGAVVKVLNPATGVEITRSLSEIDFAGSGGKKHFRLEMS